MPMPYRKAPRPATPPDPPPRPRKDGQPAVCSLTGWECRMLWAAANFGIPDNPPADLVALVERMRRLGATATAPAPSTPEGGEAHA